MEKRVQDLFELRQYTETVEKELNQILQSVNWDQNSLVKKRAMVTCKYDPNHQLPAGNKESHEKLCYLKYHGYSPNDLFFPDIQDAPENTMCKLSNDCVRRILDTASQNDPLFRRGVDNEGAEPLTLDRLQCTYTPDERRAIHDAVVKSAPALHDLSDLALPSGSGEATEKRKTRLEVLAELRDMKRRRTKYRVAANTDKYSHVLRELIKTQMEFYTTAAGVKSKDIRLDSKFIEKYNQDSRSHNRPNKNEEHLYKSSYNCNSSNNQDKYYDKPRSSYRSSYNNDNKHIAKEERHSVDRHYEHSSKHRQKYTDHKYAVTHHSKRHNEKQSSMKNNRNKHELDRDKEFNRRDQVDRCKRSRDGEPSRHSGYRKH